MIDPLQKFAFMRQMMGDIGQQAGLLQKMPGMKQLAMARQLRNAVKTGGLEGNPMMANLADQLLEAVVAGDGKGGGKGGSKGMAGLLPGLMQQMQQMQGMGGAMPGMMARGQVPAVKAAVDAAKRKAARKLQKKARKKSRK